MLPVQALWITASRCSGEPVLPVLLHQGPVLLTPKMLLLLLPLLWTGSLAQDNEFRLQMNESVTVQEGLCILVPCSFFYPRQGWIDSDPAQGYWFRSESNYFSDAPVATNDAGRKVREETKGRFHLVGDPRDYNCSLDIRDARMADKGSYFFRIVRGSYVLYNFNHYQLYVHVTALTQTPNIHIQGTLESGHPTSITCKVPWACKRGMPPTFFWIGVAVTSLGSKTSNSSELTFIPEPHHHGTNLTCRVTFPGAGVATESTIQLNVSHAPQNLTISIFWENNTSREQLLLSGAVMDGRSLFLRAELGSHNSGGRRSQTRDTRMCGGHGSCGHPDSLSQDPDPLHLPHLFHSEIPQEENGWTNGECGEHGHQGHKPSHGLVSQASRLCFQI
ncbi:sialic acid-binding Ig-like lectin 13 isoform X1 [Elephas maximus indicus]|uniref:sialic acid-binding Ig-like lectin 13 isoform X1 n=1 Tax=Elephas maximus indicus TaxID=99487 RepID=UPI0021167BF6|nr:sialic acid-binding Ig-like lectin 13 isoform X1 [Elephas maximus indicus]